MNSAETSSGLISIKAHAILYKNVPINKYALINLSFDYLELENITLSGPAQFQGYVERFLVAKIATVAYGGNLERRNLYNKNTNFLNSANLVRNIHNRCRFLDVSRYKGYGAG